MAKGTLKYIEKDRLYRYAPNSSIDKNVLDKVMHSIGSLQFVGNFFIKGFKTDGYLYELDSYDRELVKNIPLKEGEYIFRYVTYNTAVGGITPLIKINKDKLLAYFGVWEEDEVITGFTKKGDPIEYLNLVEYYSYSYDDELFMGTKNEMEEHGMSFVDAEKTANDHLKEDKHYYSKMKYIGLAEGGEVSNFGKKGTGFDAPQYSNMFNNNSYDNRGLMLKQSNNVETLGAKVLITQLSNGKFKWELILPNGQIYATQSGFNTQQDAIDNFSVAKYAQGGEVSVEIVNKDKVFNKDTYKGIYGDNDNDGIPNADDPRPNEEGDVESIEQVQLVDVFNKLLTTKTDLDSTMYEQVDKLKEISPSGSKVYARTKTPYSILNKLINKKMLDKKNPDKGLTDMVGTTIVTKNFDDINELKDKIRSGKLGKVIDFDDYYSHPKNGYMAYHFIILDKNTDVPFEVQLKTERMKKINQASHNAYKYENLDGSKLLRYTRLAQKADEGNIKAQQSFEVLTKNMKDLEMSLFKDKTKIKNYE